jgi:ParB family chromosome partitioning protein
MIVQPMFAQNLITAIHHSQNPVNTEACIAEIPLDLIDPPDPLLRPVRENTAQFAELVDYFRRDGNVSQSGLVRPIEGGRYQLCDGNRRRTALLAAGLKTMFCIIQEMDDSEYLARQIECNAGFEETDAIEYAHHLERLRKMSGSEMTLDKLAEITGKHSKWVSGVLKLNDLIRAGKEAVRRGEMSVGNAKLLAKLPLFEQTKLLEDALVLPTTKFKPIANTALSKFREAVRQGKLNRLGVDDMKPRMRSFDHIQEEMRSPSVVPMLLASERITNPVEIVKMALKWAFRLDPESIEERNNKLLKEQQQRLDDAEKRKRDRELLKIEEDKGEGVDEDG